MGVFIYRRIEWDDVPGCLRVGWGGCSSRHRRAQEQPWFKRLQFKQRPAANGRFPMQHLPSAAEDRCNSLCQTDYGCWIGRDNINLLFGTSRSSRRWVGFALADYRTVRASAVSRCMQQSARFCSAPDLWRFETTKPGQTHQNGPHLAS